MTEEKLKSLKDLKPKDIVWLQDLPKKQQEGIINEIKELERNKAIEWIKLLNSGCVTLSNGLPETAEGHKIYMIDKKKAKPIIFVLRIIFNITKGDLGRKNG